MLDKKILFMSFIALCMMQFLFPILASKIKARFRELGYEMKAEPIWSMLNVSNFWKEARTENQKHEDPLIKNYLKLRAAWWGLVIVTLIAFFVSTQR